MAFLCHGQGSGQARCVRLCLGSQRYVQHCQCYGDQGTNAVGYPVGARQARRRDQRTGDLSATSGQRLSGQRPALTVCRSGHLPCRPVSAIFTGRSDPIPRDALDPVHAGQRAAVPARPRVSDRYPDALCRSHDARTVGFHDGPLSRHRPGTARPMAAHGSRSPGSQYRQPTPGRDPAHLPARGPGDRHTLAPRGRRNDRDRDVGPRLWTAARRGKPQHAAVEEGIAPPEKDTPRPVACRNVSSGDHPQAGLQSIGPSPSAEHCRARCQVYSQCGVQQVSLVQRH